MERSADGMMGVVHLVDEIGDGELELERVGGARLVVWREPVPPPEEVTDRGCLREDQLAELQHGRCEDRMACGLACVERDDRLAAGALYVDGGRRPPRARGARTRHGRGSSASSRARRGWARGLRSAWPRQATASEARARDVRRRAPRAS